jgi:ATP-dependent helicase HrpB
LIRSDLPIDPLLPEIVAAVRAHSITLIEAEPGAGKTTCVPPALLDAGFKRVAVLEPRRLAARMAARRVASELSEEVGATVGYQVRFEQQGGPETRLWFTTEGVLTGRLHKDRLLAGVDVVILDEFHERQLDADVALGLLRIAQQERNDLRLVLMSATLNAREASRRLGGAPVLTASGRQFPVDIRYTPHSAAPLREQVANAVGRCLKKVDGHVLVFLPGAAEIRHAKEATTAVASASDADVYALHGDLPPEQQDRVVAPSDRRKIVLSTNVAESSVTIEGVRAVVDSGLARVASWSPWSGLSQLRVERISQSSAIQRAGRAGRNGPGIAIRLYSEEDFRRRPFDIGPEILRADLSPLLMQLAEMGLGVDDVPWFDAPPADAVVHATELLTRLGAISTHGRITRMGRRMSSVPVHPRLSRFVCEAVRLGAGKESSRIAAALSEGRLRVDETERKHFVSDLDAILAQEPARNVRKLEQQIANSIERDRRGGDEPHGMEKAILHGYPDRVGRRRGETVLLSNGGSARLDRASAVETEFLCAIEIEERPEQGSALIRIACPIEPDWLLEFFPDRVHSHDQLIWNRTAERAEQAGTLLYDELVIDETVQRPYDMEAASDLVVRKALETGIERFTDKTSLDRLLGRIRFAQQHSDQVQLDDGLVQKALRQIASGCSGFAELAQASRDGAFASAVESLVPMALVDEIAPAHVNLPSGRRARIEYSDRQEPWVASRLQDFFGMRDTPRVARGAVPVVVHLLGPNQRPVQMTKDLASFWRTLYPQIRRELSRRYPKHKWPENP